MDGISFQGKTLFAINPKAYETLVINPAKKACLKLGKENNCRFSRYKTSVFDTTAEDLLVIVKNKDDGFFKYVPIRGSNQSNLEYISEQLELLTNGDIKEPLTAWILGGTKLESPLGSHVITTLNKIADRLCDRPDIDTSILVGSKLGSEKFVFRPSAGQLRIDMEKNIAPNASIIDELYKAFDIVELNNTQFSTLA